MNSWFQALQGTVGQPSGEIVVVQSRAATVADGQAGVTAVFDTPLTAGNTVLAFISYSGAGGGLDDYPALVPSGALTLVRAAAGGPAECDIWRMAGVTGGETAVGFSLTDPDRASIQAIEVSGLSSFAPEDVGNNSGTGTEPALDESLAPGSALNLCVAVLAYVAASDDYVSGPTGGWTRLGTGTGGSAIFQEVAYLIQSVADPAITGWVIAHSDEYFVAGAAFGGG